MKNIRRTVAKVLIFTLLFNLLLLSIPIESSGSDNPQIEVGDPTATDGTEMGTGAQYVAPDPCGLEVVVCEGEEIGTVRTVTAYTSEISQTDGSPCISADGSNICEMWQDGLNVCAANFVPFGTVLEVEGLGTCTVHDRMASRHAERVDWYFGYDTPGALEFGLQKRNVTIIQ